MSSYLKVDIAQKLRELIEERGLIKSEIARRAGLDKNYLYIVLKGDRRPKPETLEQILNAIGGITLEEFLRDEEAHVLIWGGVEDSKVIPYSHLELAPLPTGYTKDRAEQELVRALRFNSDNYYPSGLAYIKPTPLSAIKTNDRIIVLINGEHFIRRVIKKDAGLLYLQNMSNGDEQVININTVGIVEKVFSANFD